MLPFVLLKLPNGDLVQGFAGDIIGRLWTCAVPITDERVSEAHAMISLRGGTLRLLNLRGAICINRALVDDPILEEGLVFEIAPGLAIEVVEVFLPCQLLAVQGPGIPRRPLSGTISVRLDQAPYLHSGFHPRSQGWFFGDGLHWFFRSVGAGTIGPLQPTDVVTIDGKELLLSLIEADDGSCKTLGRPASYKPLSVVSFYDQVRIFRLGSMLCEFSGLSARILSELLEVGAPISWQAVASAVWRDCDDRWVLRRRWDTSLRRIRKVLLESGIRASFISSDGTGCVAVVLYPEDTLEQNL